jgi:hypothetical protein
VSDFPGAGRQKAPVDNAAKSQHASLIETDRFPQRNLSNSSVPFCNSWTSSHPWPTSEDQLERGKDYPRSRSGPGISFPSPVIKSYQPTCSRYNSKLSIVSTSANGVLVGSFPFGRAVMDRHVAVRDPRTMPESQRNDAAGCSQVRLS